mmetsp:Transcript_73050/g.184973  ORF Transcript_73050/g.184973 Transcript_73050/m.184973 type:complete len:126 (+) Transcript_73050:198-575(+)
MYDILMRAVELQGIKLHSCHVLVSNELEEVVRNVVLFTLPREAKVKLKGRKGTRVPLALATWEVQQRCPIIVECTFIKIQGAASTSLRSPPSDGPRTASTGDMKLKLKPRRCASRALSSGLRSGR